MYKCAKIDPTSPESCFNNSEFICNFFSSQRDVAGEEPEPDIEGMDSSGENKAREVAAALLAEVDACEAENEQLTPAIITK